MSNKEIEALMKRIAMLENRVAILEARVSRRYLPHIEWFPDDDNPDEVHPINPIKYV